ncbi:MAG: hypothetical protein JNM19_17835 [Chitinophagaceae bacterium]|nr:hypothetical protein [Chitinophagaceae bacterium]
MLYYKNLLVAGLLLTVFGAAAQTEENTKLSTISLYVAPPVTTGEVSEAARSMIEEKITSLITESGIASAWYNNSFVAEPKLMVNGVQTTAGGMRNIMVADCSFSIIIKQQNSAIIFSQYSRNIKGSGFNKEEAVSNAISQIEFADDKAAKFIENAKSKIISYYNQNCELILQKAEKYRSMKEYQAALSILLTVPEEATTCYARAQQKAPAVFKEMQNLECKKYILQAQTAAAAKDFDNALETLSWIDPTGVCQAEAKALIKKIEAETTDDKKKQWQFVFKALDGTIEIGKARAAAMSNLTLYWMRQQSGRTIIVN